MKKNQSASSAAKSVQELRERYEQSASETPPSVSPSAHDSPKDKRSSSPKLEELKKLYEQSASETPPPISPSANGSPKDKRQPSPKLEELKKLYEQSASETPPPISPSANGSPKEKRQPSPKLEELKKRYEQSASETTPPISPSANGSPKDKRQHHTPENPEKLQKHHEQSATGPEQSGLQEPLYATPAPPQSVPITPQTPPRMRVSEQKSPSSQQDEGIDEAIYATPRPQTPPRMRVSEQKNPSSQQDEGIGEEIYATPRPQTPPRTQRTSGNTMGRQVLISAYYEEIRYWCQIVYGNRFILDERLKEVQENPNMGEQLSWEISEHPQSISKLAGKEVLCLKTKARKAAERNVSSLCEAIDGLTYTLKYIQEATVKVSQAEQSPHEEQSTQQVQKAENLQQPFSSEKEKKPLSLKEIANTVEKDPLVLYGQAEIRYWCKLVYGNPFVLQDRTEDIQKVPVLGEELSWQVENDPTMFSKLAGRKILCIKSSARKKAEKNISNLCTAINDYTDTVKEVRERIVQEHQAQQEHQSGSFGLAQNLQKQQTLSSPPKLPEKTLTARNNAAETSRQEQRKSPDVRQHKAQKAQVHAFSS